jgi:pimeloyl-ACP methyl ester carboxylesterase
LRPRLALAAGLAQTRPGSDEGDGVRRSPVLQLAILAVAIYAAAVVGLYLLQDRMLFPRDATPPPRDPLPAGSEQLTLATPEDGVLHGVLVPASAGRTPLVLGFPGNAWNAQDFAVFLHERLPSADVVAFHYRGYPPSDGHPSERALTRDAIAIVDHLRERFADRPLVLVGVSLGSGVAAAVMAEREVAGAVLVTPFDSIRAIARERYRWVPVDLLLRHPFDSAARLAGVDRPVVVISAGRDELVPPARTRALVERVPNLLDHHVFADDDHGSLYDAERFGDVLRRAVAAVAAEGG